jgi:pimeloyl-ACP methyl ester carboxylesterase
MLDKFFHKTLRIPYTLALYEKRHVNNAKNTLVFLHGVGASGAAWNEVLKNLKDAPANILVVDLLGFGKSPKPEWAQYSAKMQSRALAKTLLAKGVFGNAILVGHSMGSLIAIEFAKRYPLAVKGLVLCSPPLYDDRTNKYLPERDEQLKKLYLMMTSNPDRFVVLSELAQKYGLVGRAFSVSADTVDDYISALKAAIIKQTSLKDIANLNIPIEITYGTLDTFVINSHYKKLASSHENISTSSFFGGHEIEGRYVPLVVDAIDRMLENF